MTPIFTATVTEAGNLRLDSPLTFQRHLARFKNKRVEVFVRRVRTQRSNQANRYYWGVVVALLAEEFGIRRTEPGPRTYPVFVSKSKAYVVNAKAFIKFYGLPTVSTGRIKSTMSDGILSIPVPLSDEATEEKA